VGARPGVGLTFAELRAYEPGDDVRHLDWNVTARQGRPYVRRFIEERSLRLYLILDISASMRFGPEGSTKADRAAQAAALLAASAVQSGDQVGLMMVTDRLETEVPPGGGGRHLARILRALITTPAASRKTDLTAALGRIREVRRRSLVVVLTDALDPSTSAIWRAVSRHHEVFVLRMVDPREESLPRAGLIALQDAETGERRLIDSSSRRVAAAYEKAAQERRAAFLRLCREARMIGADIPTDRDPLGPLLEFFRERGARALASQRSTPSGSAAKTAQRRGLFGLGRSR